MEKLENHLLESGEGNPAIVQVRDSAGRLERVEITVEPFTAYGETKTALSLKAPKGKHRLKIGNPYVLANGGVDIVLDRVIQYAAALSNTPRSVFEDMGMEDLDAIQEAVLLFFGDRKPGRTATGNPASTT